MIWTCPDLPRPVQEDKPLPAKQAFISSQKLHLSLFYEPVHHSYKIKIWKGVLSEKIKPKTCFADKDLSSWTGLGRSGHVQIMTFHKISYLSGDSKTTPNQHKSLNMWTAIYLIFNIELLLILSGCLDRN